MYGRNITLSIGRSHVRTLMPEVLALLAARKIQPEKINNVVADFSQAPRVLTEHLRSPITKTVLIRKS